VTATAPGSPALRHCVHRPHHARQIMATESMPGLVAAGRIERPTYGL